MDRTFRFGVGTNSLESAQNCTLLRGNGQFEPVAALMMNEKFDRAENPKSPERQRRDWCYGKIQFSIMPL
jgi:hypothetical protein